MKYPARASLVGYLSLIVLGTLVLWQSLCGGRGEKPISLLDAAFTATSATCVTGLAVRSTPDDFSGWGQLVILALIQIGGVGIMTVTTYLMFSVGGRAGLRHRAALADMSGGDAKADLKWLLRNVLLITLLFEGGGFLILAIRFLFLYSPGKALWHALFHSVSAFCNAGFALHNESLEHFRADVVVNATVMSLIVFGGIGFPVMLDVARNWRRGWRDGWDHLHLHSKLMLIGTTALLLLGTLIFLVLEWNDTLADLPLWQRVMMSAFQSVTCRTAGFNTTRLSLMTNASLFVTIVLMAIGAGPGSTGGGFKVSTLMVLVSHAWATFRGYDRANLFRRTIPATAAQKAIATAMLFILVAAVALTLLLALEQSSTPHSESQGAFFDALFEVVSALGTVGLSTGMTPHLTDGGKMIIIALMFAGRLGPISVFVALSRGERTARLEYPKEEPLIG